MNPREASNILSLAGAVGTALHKEVAAVENMLLSTDEQIQRIAVVTRRLKQVKTDVLNYYDEEGMDAAEFILTIGHALRPLAKTKCRLEAKRDGLRLVLDNLNAAVRASNKFANKLPAIPKMA